MDKQQILIVDDEEVNREILGWVFQSEYEDSVGCYHAGA